LSTIIVDAPLLWIVSFSRSPLLGGSSHLVYILFEVNPLVWLTCKHSWPLTNHSLITLTNIEIAKANHWPFHHSCIPLNSHTISWLRNYDYQFKFFMTFKNFHEIIEPNAHWIHSNKNKSFKCPRFTFA